MSGRRLRVEVTIPSDNSMPRDLGEAPDAKVGRTVDNNGVVYRDSSSQAVAERRTDVELLVDELIREELRDR